MSTVSREFDTKEKAEDWIEEMKVTDNVKSSRIEENAIRRWKAIVDTE